jgi:hypothetical protein
MLSEQQENTGQSATRLHGVMPVKNASILVTAHVTSDAK